MLLVPVVAQRYIKSNITYHRPVPSARELRSGNTAPGFKGFTSGFESERQDARHKVASLIIEDDDVAGFQGRCQGLLHPGGEGRPIDGAIEDVGSDDPVMAQARQIRSGFSSGRGKPWPGVPLPEGSIRADASC